MSAIGWFGAAASPLPKKFNAATLTGRTHRKTGSVGIERIGPLIAEHAAAAEADRRLSDAVYHAMYEAGAIRDARAESLWRPGAARDRLPSVMGSGCADRFATTGSAYS